MYPAKQQPPVFDLALTLPHWVLCCTWLILLIKHWSCFLVLKLQVLNSTTIFGISLYPAKSALLQGQDCKTSLGQFGWKYCTRCDSSQPARIGIGLCMARKFCCEWEPAVYISLSLSLSLDSLARHKVLVWNCSIILQQQVSDCYPWSTLVTEPL